MVLDARGITAFFSVVGRTISEAELRYYLDIFGQGVPDKGAPLSLVGGPSHAQYVLAVRKWRRALRIARVLRMFPWIQGVGIGNSLAFASVHEESDIDLVILCQPNRVWMSRFFAVLLLRMLRLRPGEAAHDPVCPSFFVAPDAFNLQAIAIEDDVYLRFWLATLSPIWGQEAFAQFFAANQWAVMRTAATIAARPGWSIRLMRRVFALASFVWVEQLLRKVQLRMMPAAIHAKALMDDRGVVLTDAMLKFHEEDGRVAYRDRWKAQYGTHS